jgi:hypothetical protein
VAVHWSRAVTDRVCDCALESCGNSVSGLHWSRAVTVLVAYTGVVR